MVAGAFRRGNAHNQKTQDEKMIKLSSVTFAAVLAATSMSATAGISPNTGGTAMSQSGAKIAPTTPAVEERKDHQNEQPDSSAK
jgi:hypothetical protein